MNRATLTILVAAFLCGCADGQFRAKAMTTPDCGQIKGFTASIIHYGDSRIFVIPISKIKAGSEFRFILAPKLRSKTDATDYRQTEVTVHGKRDPEDLWFTPKTGKYSDSPTIVVCVPDPIPGGLSQYQYIVEVDGVGMLDPRADIIIDN